MAFGLGSGGRAGLSSGWGRSDSEQITDALDDLLSGGNGKPPPLPPDPPGEGVLDGTPLEPPPPPPPPA